VANPLAGLDPQSLTIDSPVPFSLKRLWYELIDFETTTFTGQQRDQPALEEAGNPDALRSSAVYAPCNGCRWAVFGTRLPREFGDH